MSILDAISRRPAQQSKAVPQEVRQRVERGRKEMRKDAFKRLLCQLFLDGEQYAYLNTKGTLANLETARGVGGKPDHRVRNRYNFIRPMVDAKVSASTTRVPGYEVNPASTDPEDLAGARLAQKIAHSKYDTWRLRESRVKAATLAIGGGGAAFALPYFDSQVGPFREVPDEFGNVEMVGEGEIKVLILNGNEVFWEPGVDFYHSRWYGVEHARPISELTQDKDYIGPEKLQPNASTSLNRDKPTDDMVLVQMYFERPCPKYPNGRMLTMVNDQQVLPESPYPLRHKGQVIDEPCIHRLVYRLDPINDDDLGLTWELVDFQRTISDVLNKIVELKSRALHLQLLAPTGSLRAPRTDEPGGVIYYNPIGGLKPEWEKGPDPGILGQLQAILARTLEDMRYVAADTDVSAAPNVAADAVNAVIQQAANRWSQYIADLAAWDSKVMRHCLLLAQQHYTEDRLLQHRGRFGWEPVESFRGADINGQVDVTVNPATIETRTRAAMLQTLSWIQANFPGYVRPEVAMEIAMYGQSLDTVIESFEFDKARINEVIQRIRDGSVMEMPSRLEMTQGIDPETGEPTMVPTEVPGWMPREFDSIDVQMWVYTNWLKTPDAANLPPEMYEVAMLVYQGMRQLQDKQQAEAMAAQTAQAEQLGAKNAAKPQMAKPLPSTPAPQ